MMLHLRRKDSSHSNCAPKALQLHRTLKKAGSQRLKACALEHFLDSRIPTRCVTSHAVAQPPYVLFGDIHTFSLELLGRVNVLTFFFQHAWFFLFYWIFQDRIAVEGDEWEWEVHWRHRAALRPGSRQVAGEKRGLKKAGAMAARGAGEARPTGEGCHVKSVC